MRDRRMHPRQPARGQSEACAPRSALHRMVPTNSNRASTAELAGRAGEPVRREGPERCFGLGPATLLVLWCRVAAVDLAATVAPTRGDSSSAATATWATTMSGSAHDFQGGGGASPLSCREVADRHDRVSARGASHHGAARVSPRRRGNEGCRAARLDRGSVRAVYRSAAREVSRAVPVVCSRWSGSAATRADPITFVASCRAIGRASLLRRFNGVHHQRRAIARPSRQRRAHPAHERSRHPPERGQRSTPPDRRTARHCSASRAPSRHPAR